MRRRRRRRRRGPRTSLTRESSIWITTSTGATLRMLSKIPMYGDLAETVRHHHEKHDGSGYPDGLKGDQIPAMARVMIVADAFDAMTTARIPGRCTWERSSRWRSRRAASSCSRWTPTTRPCSRRRLPRKKATKLVSFAGQGRWLAVATRKHAVVLHDLTAKAHFGPFAGHKSKVDSIAVSPDDKLLATGDDCGQVIVWEIACARDTRQVQTLKLTGGGVTALAFGPDRLLAAAAADRSMTVWRLVAPPTNSGL